MRQSQDKVETDGQLRLFKRRRSEIPDAERVLVLQEKLYQKAKQVRGYKFYVLYDKMLIPYMLREAWKQVKSNDGAPGIDGKTIEDIEQYGVEKYLEELKEDLRKHEYKPQAVKRAMIEKESGGERPIGIPIVRDRIAQTMCKMIIEPIFEADFEESSYGFRPRRDAKGAMAEIKAQLHEGNTEVYDADLSKYFDTIPHEKLMIALKERIADPRILRLINTWLKAPVYEDGQFKSSKGKGTPQGGVISPLLSNVYLHLLDRIVNNPRSLFRIQGVKMVRYADDFVLMGKAISEEVTERLKSLLGRMGLSLNETKTRWIKAREESFNFLGFTIRYDRDIHGRSSKYWNIVPSKRAEQRIRDNVSDYLKKHGHSPAKEIATGVNVRVRGWLNYYGIEGVSYLSKSKRQLRYYMVDRLKRYYNRKSQRKSRLYGQKAFEVLTVKYGMIDPTKYAY